MITNTVAILLRIEPYDKLRFMITIDLVLLPNVRQQKSPTKNFTAVTEINARCVTLLYFMGFCMEPSIPGNTVWPQYENIIIPKLTGKVLMLNEGILSNVQEFESPRVKPNRIKAIINTATTASILSQARMDSLLMKTVGNMASAQIKHHSFKFNMNSSLNSSMKLLPRTITIRTQLQYDKLTVTKSTIHPPTGPQTCAAISA